MLSKLDSKCKKFGKIQFTPLSKSMIFNCTYFYEFATAPFHQMGILYSEFHSDFDVSLTVHPGITLDNDKLNAQIF